LISLTLCLWLVMCSKHQSSYWRKVLIPHKASHSLLAT